MQGKAATATDTGSAEKIFLPNFDEKQPFSRAKKHMFADLRPGRKKQRNN
jgi:hypothetical protein